MTHKDAGEQARKRRQEQISARKQRENNEVPKSDSLEKLIKWSVNNKSQVDNKKNIPKKSNDLEVGF